MSDPIIRELQEARIRLILHWPIFGAFILGLELQEAEWLETAATDGRHFFYNREFIKRLNRDQLVFLTAHECLHCIYDHIFRRGHRDPDIWNYAVDFIVNWILLNTKDSNGRIKPIGQIIKDVYPVVKPLYNPAYSDDFTAEELYDLLEKDYTKEKLLLLGMPIDMHLDGGSGDDNSSSDESGNSCKDDQPGDSKDGPPKLSEEEIEAIRDMLKATLLQALQQPGVDAGTVPAGVRRRLDALVSHKIDWRQMLDTVLRSSLKHDYTYTRLSRRCWTTGLTLPGQDHIEKVMAAAFLDGSGSTTSEMITDFLSECKGIVTTFPDFELLVGTFDTKVYDVQTYTPDNADDIDNYDFHGGGGTRPSCCWEWLQQHDIVPDRLLIFTDGYVSDDWGDPDYCQTLFIIHTHPTVKPTHGVTLYYDAK